MSEASPQRFRILHEGDAIGFTLFEGGDPDSRGVSGLLHNVAGAQALAGFIKSIGGTEDDGAVYIVMNSDFIIEDAEGNTIPFDEATLIAVPNDEQAYIDVSGIPDHSYHAHFAHHVEAALNARNDSAD